MSDDEKFVLDEDAPVATPEMAGDDSDETAEDKVSTVVAGDAAEDEVLEVVADEAEDEPIDGMVADEEVDEVVDEKPKTEAQKRHEERLARHASKHAAQEKHAARQEKHAENKKGKKSDSGKKKFGLWRWIKAVFLELKKVTWPSFPKVVKTTAVVLGIVLFFLAVLVVMDFTLGQLYGRMMYEVFRTATVTSLNRL